MPGVRDKHRKVHVGVFTGEEFHLRKIKPTEFMEFFGTLPAENSDTLTAQLRLLGEKLNAAAQEKKSAEDLMRFYLERGVMSPKIFFGPYDECPEDKIHVDDLSDDANALVNIISEFSFDFTGFKKKMEDLLQLQQSALAGPGGEAVQQTPNGAAPTGDSS
jgi:hypothetical protein